VRLRQRLRSRGSGAALERAAELSSAAVALGCTASGVIGGGVGRRGAGGGQRARGGAAGRAAARLPPRGAARRRRARPSSGCPELAPDELADAVVVLLTDPYSFPVDGFLAQANAVLPGLAVVGAVAAGPRGTGSTRLLLDGRLVQRGAVGVLLQGSGAKVLISQGCRPVGPPMTVTAAEGNVVRGVAGVPAMQRVEELLEQLPPADQALASVGLQLGIAMDEYAEDHEFLMRSVVGSETGTGGVVVSGPVEVGPHRAAAGPRRRRGRRRPAPAAGRLPARQPRRPGRRRAAVLLQRPGARSCTAPRTAGRPRPGRRAVGAGRAGAWPASSPAGSSVPSPGATTCTASRPRCWPSPADACGARLVP
jgi:hypothetical protein